MMQEALNERKRLSAKLTDHEVRKRSHFIVSLTLWQRDNTCNGMK